MTVTGGRIGPYLLGEPLGQGGMGSVYRARHLDLDVERALKVMHRVDGHGLARFEREARALAQVQHPNVVAIHESGQVDGHPYFVMDLLAGQPLDEHLANRPPWREGLRTVIGIARGVGALHTAGVIHRDLKPQNIVLTDDGRPVVIDLGLAVAPERDERLTKTGAFVGTVAYMAPEQFESGAVTPRSDVYALGLLTFQLATGTPAIEELTAAHETVAWILTGVIPPPSSRDLDLPAELDAIFARATARDPQDRYPDGDALADALEALLENPGPTARERRGSSRLALGAGLVALGALVALGLSRIGTADPAPSESPDLAPTLQTDPTPTLLGDRSGGDGALRRARRSPNPAAALRAWLERYPKHPLRAEAERQLLELRLSTPRLRLTIPGGLPRAVVWINRDRFVTAAGKTLTLFDGRAGAEVERRVQEREITALTSTANMLALGDTGGQVGWIDTDKDLEYVVQRVPLASRVDALAFSPNGQRVAVAEAAMSVSLLPLPLLQTEQSLKEHRAPVHALTFSPDGRDLYTGCGISATRAFQQTSTPDCAVRCYRIELGRVAQWRHVVTGKPNQIAVTTDGDLLAVGVSTGQVVLLRARTGKLKRSFYGVTEKSKLGARLAHGGGVRGLAFSANGRLLYTVGETAPGGTDGGIRTWDTRSGALLRTQAGGQPYYGLALRPGGAEVLVWTREAVELWPVR